MTEKTNKMDITKLKNNKYFKGDFREPNEYKGWFVGDFLDSAHPCKTDKLEVAYKEHEKGDVCKPHYHEQKVELIILLKGSAKYTVNGEELILHGGSYLFVDVNNIISSEYLEDSRIFAIHAPSIPTDKVVV